MRELNMEDGPALDCEMKRDAANLVVASRLFRNPERSEAFTGLYSFMREVDDRVDRILEEDLSGVEIRRIEKRVREYEAIACGGFAERIPARLYPLRDRFRRINDRFGIPGLLWRNFFNAMWVDFRRGLPVTRDDFLRYAEGASVAATTIYLILIGSTLDAERIAYRWHDDYRSTGRNLGIWAYTIHIARDFQADMRAGKHGRRLIPRSFLDDHGLTHAEIRRQAMHRKLSIPGRDMVLSFLDWGDEYGKPGKNHAVEIGSKLPFHRARILGLIVAIYSEISRRVRRLDGNVFGSRDIFPRLRRGRFASRVLGAETWDEMVSYW